MCFKKPKLPQLSPEEKAKQDALDAELAAQRANAKRQIAEDLRTEKDAMTEAALARALGFVGNRSLIAGPKGGAGFMGQGTGRTVVRVATPTPAPPAAVIPPNQVPTNTVSGPGSVIGAYTGGGYTGSNPYLAYKFSMIER